MRTASELLMPGMRAGLFGGSFNPAHEGHLHITRMALQRMNLHRVWWMVSPGNPLKEENGMAPLEARLASARQMADDPRICVTDVEARLGTRYTVDTLHALTGRHPHVHFVWLMGADNLIQFPKWKGWEEIAALMPIAVLPRPGFTMKARLCKAAQVLEPWRMESGDAALLPLVKAPALGFIEGPEHPASATAIRARAARAGLSSWTTSR